MDLPGPCEDEPGISICLSCVRRGDRIWFCLSLVRRGQNMSLSGTCEDEQGIWICLSRERKEQDVAQPGTCEKVTGYGSACHV
jgi:hypothetical protein